MTKFIGSSLYREITSSFRKEGLENLRSYSKSAIEYWKNQGNEKEMQFFSNAVELIDKKLKLRKVWSSRGLNDKQN